MSFATLTAGGAMEASASCDGSNGGLEAPTPCSDAASLAITSVASAPRIRARTTNLVDSRGRCSRFGSLPEAEPALLASGGRQSFWLSGLVPNIRGCT
jgi:hypothetical protein